MRRVTAVPGSPGSRYLCTSPVKVQRPVTDGFHGAEVWPASADHLLLARLVTRVQWRIPDDLRGNGGLCCRSESVGSGGLRRPDVAAHEGSRRRGSHATCVLLATYPTPLPEFLRSGPVGCYVNAHVSADVSADTSANIGRRRTPAPPVPAGAHYGGDHHDGQYGGNRSELGAEAFVLSDLDQ